MTLTSSRSLKTHMGKSLPPQELGELKEGNHLLDNPAALREAMADQGYILLRNYLDVDDVLAARRECLGRLATDGVLDESQDLMEGILKPGVKISFRPDIAQDNQPLAHLLYDGRKMDFFTTLLGGPVRHFDYTWLRTVGPGEGTRAHCDIVYMGRGTDQLYTAWTPLGKTDLEMGGLVLLEGSHKHQRLRETYGTLDVDAYCVNKDGPASKTQWQTGRGGGLFATPQRLRESLGGRWLTSEFQPGDVLIFGMYVVHAGLDNQSENRLRLSSDSRYQLVNLPADARWIGPNPPGHAGGAKGLIC